MDPRPNAYGNSYEAPVPPPTTTFVSSASMASHPRREEAGLGITLRESLSGRNLSVRQAFDIFDSDKNGSLDMTEMCAALYHLGLKAISAEQVVRFFHLIDEDKTGRIAFRDFHNFVEVAVEESLVEWKPHTGQVFCGSRTHPRCHFFQSAGGAPKASRASMATNHADDTDSPDHAACVLDGDRPLGAGHDPEQRRPRTIEPFSAYCSAERYRAIFGREPSGE